MPIRARPLCGPIFHCSPFTIPNSLRSLDLCLSLLRRLSSFAAKKLPSRVIPSIRGKNSAISRENQFASPAFICVHLRSKTSLSFPSFLWLLCLFAANPAGSNFRSHDFAIPRPLDTNTRQQRRMKLLWSLPENDMRRLRRSADRRYELPPASLFQNRICRPEGGFGCVGIGCYKEAAPDGA